MRDAGHGLARGVQQRLRFAESPATAAANAAALDQAGTHIVTLAQDNAFGKDGVKAFKGAVKKAIAGRRPRSYRNGGRLF